MRTVQHVLNTKPVQVYSVTASSSVLDGLKMMTEKNISALLIMEAGTLQGIFTERDYARKIILHGKASKDTPISEAMTLNPITVTSSDSIDSCMEIMTEKHIRHLPVVNENQVVGMVSIGDVVKLIIADQKQTISQLESYINS
ncbi:CBS domain-containing protein [Pedobacter insulae]|uniref:CBS domain-containing protein n=1 Tax=Pedobacter insulae TaxID=414048 RepID=A0A1I2ZUJ0_9SPHI|nr:CBS domain-containing protein [Pedobacter insulae]SFH41350.1 CBS domain-containing protein [Pedobacter insulae]